MPETDSISKSNRTRDQFHPLCLNSAAHCREVLRRHPRVDAGFRDRARSIALCSPMMTCLAGIERLFYGRRIARTRLDRPPVFVIGHWRSGTTLLHNLLSNDPQFGFVSLYQTLAPEAFLIGRAFLQPILALRAPKTRPMDTVEIRMQYPSEDEFALAHQCPQSPYLGWYFPSDWPELFRQYGLWECNDAADRQEWAAAYREILIKATIHFGGRQLVLKNPINTGRVAALLELFPGAKFIHIHRNPYDVFRATVHLFREVHRTVTLQDVTDAQIVSYTLDFYPRMMNAYWEQRDLIPAGNHTEVRYDDLTEEPLVELERIYSELNLAGWEYARPSMARLQPSLARHRKNEYVDDPALRALVDEHWGFAFDRLGYEKRVADLPKLC